MKWLGVIAFLIFCWSPFLFEGGLSKRNSKESLTGDWAERALMLFYLICGLGGTAIVVRDLLNAN
jgi:hypothetical protein